MPKYNVRIAGPLEPFGNRAPGTFLGSWKLLSRIYTLDCMTSIQMAQEAVDRGFITKPGTYALVVSKAREIKTDQICLVSVKEEPPLPVKPRLVVSDV